MHSNSVHTAKDDEANWNGISITFTKGKPVKFNDAWEVMFIVAQGLLDMLKQVINSKPSKVNTATAITRLLSEVS
jgi:hypothetical protein